MSDFTVNYLKDSVFNINTWSSIEHEEHEMLGHLTETSFGL